MKPRDTNALQITPPPPDSLQGGGACPGTRLRHAWQTPRLLDLDNDASGMKAQPYSMETSRVQGFTRVVDGATVYMDGNEFVNAANPTPS